MITPEKFEAVCEMVETTSFGVQSCLGQLFPELNIKQFYRYLHSNEEARQRYARAKESQAELIADEIIDIADNATNDFMTVVKGDLKYEAENKEVINRSRLRIDSRKWILSKLLPKKYGDKLDITSDGEKLPTPPTTLTVRIAKEKENASD